MPPDSDPPWINFAVSSERFVVFLSFFNIYANDYVVINGHIPPVKYIIYTLYDCFLGAGANYAIYWVNHAQ